MNDDVKENVDNISVADVPKLIEDQFELMTSLKENLNLAKSHAKDADLKVREAKEKRIGLFNKKDAMEAMQNSQMSLSEATLKNTEALEKTFEYQQALTNITKFLFGLGVSNIAVNRTIVRELELRLEHASEEEIDDMARQELLNVVHDLKAQEDITKKQTDFSLRLKNVNDELDGIDSDLQGLKQHYNKTIKALNNKITELEHKTKVLQIILILTFLCAIAGIVLAILLKYLNKKKITCFFVLPSV